MYFIFLNILVILMRHSYFKDKQREETMSNLENEIHTKLYELMQLNEEKFSVQYSLFLLWLWLLKSALRFSEVFSKKPTNVVLHISRSPV